MKMCPMITLPDGWIVESIHVTRYGLTLAFRNGYYLHCLQIAEGEITLEAPNGTHIDIASEADFPDSDQRTIATDLAEDR